MRRTEIQHNVNIADAGLIYMPNLKIMNYDVKYNANSQVMSDLV